jgi:CRP/FNR family cyclic AMP-dependent transcriptional regulator
MSNHLRLRHQLVFLEGLPAEAQQALRILASASRYGKGATLFVAGERPRGIFLLNAGKVKVLAGTSQDRKVTLKIAGPGEVLGLSATLTGHAYEATAEAIGPARADFVSRADFLHFLQQHPEASFRVVQALGHQVYGVHERAGFFRGARSASGRLATLLLAWCADTGAESEEGIRVTVPLTEREIGQMIGTSRETIARLVGKLTDLNIVQHRGGVFLIRDKAALEGLARQSGSPPNSYPQHLPASLLI